jgi:hypothetical protein
MDDYSQHKKTNAIQRLGFGDWFENSALPMGMENCEIARVVGVFKENYTLNKGHKDIQGQLLGSLVYSSLCIIE